MPRRYSGIGPYSRYPSLAKIDGRSREAVLMRLVRAELIAHVGNELTVTRRLLIERAVVLSLRVAQIDAKIIAGEPLTQHDNNQGIAWNNALRRVLEALGLDPTNAKPADPLAALHAHLARRAEEAA